MEPIRLNKYLSVSGVCSRREADRLIEAGAVLVDGHPAEMGMLVSDQNEVTYRGQLVRPSEELVLLAVYKPPGVVCTTARHKGEQNIVDLVNYPVRLVPVGRLDKASEGLILMTNQGELSDRILRSRNGHEKEYLVKVDKPVTLDFLQKMRAGVPILDTVTRPCKVKKTEERAFQITLTQGLNRQIRRMCETLGYRVTYLKRIRVMNIELKTLTPGTYRLVEGEELQALLKSLVHCCSND